MTAPQVIQAGEFDYRIVYDDPAVPFEAYRVIVRGLALDEGTQRPPRATLSVQPDHPFADKDRIDVEDLGEESFVGWPARSMANGAIDHVFRIVGRDRRLTLQVDDAQTMLEFVAYGLGVALLPAYLAADRPPS